MRQRQGAYADRPGCCFDLAASLRFATRFAAKDLRKPFGPEPPMKKLVLETTAPFQGLPELVAYDEGLFANEGLEIEWADREAGVEKKVEAHVTTPKGVNPFASHGKLLEQGKADMYNACEWGNYCRVQDTGQGSRQLGRRAIVAYSAVVVPPDSPVYTPQQLANKTIGVPFYFGTHYIALHLLEGFLPREMIKLCRAPNGSRYRFDAMMRGEIDATTLTEPHITLAEKKGCRVICSSLFHGTEVASDRVDAETYAAFNRAVREAVRRINANKKAYMHYFIDYYAKKDPEIAALKVEDLRESRLVVCDPAPIPADEMQRTYDWLKSWGMLEETASPLQLINTQVQNRAHEAAE
jgi:NitT/TauT family transport system substrate-binding protein